MPPQLKSRPSPMVEASNRTLPAKASRSGDHPVSAKRHGSPSCAAPMKRGLRVGDAILGEPTVHDASVSIADIRELFLDDHMHMALLVEAGRLVAIVERQDLMSFYPDEMPARSIGVLSGRTIGPDASLSEAADAMQRVARRRLAVIDDHGALLGLLCLKARGAGFCSDQDVRNRREGSSTAAHGHLLVR